MRIVDSSTLLHLSRRLELGEQICPLQLRHSLEAAAAQLAAPGLELEWYQEMVAGQEARSRRDERIHPVLVITDTHGTLMCERAWDAVCRLMEDRRPQLVIHAGDVVDFPKISRHSKDPRVPNRVRAEIEIGREIFRKIRYLCGADAEIYCREGNHDRRLRDYLGREAPEIVEVLEEMCGVTFPRLLELDKQRVNFELEEDDLWIGEDGRALEVVHGWTCRKHSAAGHLELVTPGNCGVSGHVHRLAKRWRTQGRVSTWWVEAGHLGTTDYSRWGYLKRRPDWQQGFAWGYRFEDRHGRRYIDLDPVQIYDGRFQVDGTIYKCTGRQF